MVVWLDLRQSTSEVGPFGLVRRQGDRRGERRRRLSLAAESIEQLAAHGGEILAVAEDVVESVEHRQRGGGTLGLGDGDGPIEPHDRRAGELLQLGVQGGDRRPVGGGRRRRGGVGRGDQRLESVTDGDALRGRIVGTLADRPGEQAQTLGDLVVVPLPAVLIGEQDRSAVVADATRATRVLEHHQGPHAP